MTDYFNRTKRYLLPVLNTYPKTFKTELRKNPFNLYVCDAEYYKSKNLPFQNLFFIHTNYNKELVNVSRGLKYYVDEYPVNLHNQYMIVVNLPDKYIESYQNFLTGQYNRIYTKEMLKELNIPQIYQGQVNLTYCVLIGSPLAFEDYTRILKDVYGVSNPNWIPANPDQYDIPPRICQEVLNYRGNEEYVKSICPLKNF